MSSPKPPQTSTHPPQDVLAPTLREREATGEDLDINSGDYLGSYSSVVAYLRAMLEPEVSPACAWILDHLDYQAIQRRWESDGGRLMWERGHVYRLGAPDEVRVREATGEDLDIDSGDPPGQFAVFLFSDSVKLEIHVPCAIGMGGGGSSIAKVPTFILKSPDGTTMNSGPLAAFRSAK